MKEAFRVSDEEIAEYVESLKPSYDHSLRTMDRSRGTFVQRVSFSGLGSDLAKLSPHESLPSTDGRRKTCDHIIRLRVAIANTHDGLLMDIPYDLRVGPDHPQDSFFRKVFNKSDPPPKPIPNLKQMLAEATGVPIDLIRLSFNTSPVLADSALINQYDIINGSTIYMHVKLHTSDEIVLCSPAAAKIRRERLLKINRAVVKSQLVETLKVKRRESSK